jgi:hypothetical protein
LNISKPRLKNFYKTLDELWSDQVFPPNPNRLTWERDVEILIRAQEKSSRGPPLWCKPAKNLPAAIEGDTHERATVTIPDSDIRIQNNIAAYKIYKAKSETDKCSEAKEIVTLLADCLPLGKHERLMSLLNKWATSPTSAEEASLSSSSGNLNNTLDGQVLPPKGTKINFCNQT